MIETLVRDILKMTSIETSSLKHIKSVDDEHIYFINDEYVLRITHSNVDNQIKRLEQVGGLQSVPKILYRGNSLIGTKYNYYICNKIPGIDYIDAVQEMSKQQNIDLGYSISSFLNTLHDISGSYYDIGHYIPVVPHFAGTWKEGHRQYWEFINRNLKKIETIKENQSIFNEVFQYFETYSEALNQQRGSVLLHNDLHPRNIIIEIGKFSGVIDWECSQYGEPDFEYCHFIHWCLYPPKPEIDLKHFLGSLFKESQICSQFKQFPERQTIYQLEHEMMQIIWSRGHAQAERMPKIRNWLNGSVK